MGSNEEVTLAAFERLVHPIVKMPEVGSLKTWGTKLNKLQRSIFTQRYGNLLDLLEIKVQTGAITTLIQFYDPPLRCFTFQDFQLAPTLEEYGKILGYSLNEIKPYRCLSQSPL